MKNGLKKYNEWSEERVYSVKFKAQHYVGQEKKVKDNLSQKNSACSGGCGSACGSSCSCAGPCS